ncbi:YybH family protein [Zobellia uliginosa]|uniref:YybH family protein n=1 Tax=Zobellia uliginosa TaxID=143224 RepID=UPI001C06A1A0|nr:nuclear transport factor 2 family protein [Zobellia uliginosa]MBU2946167.1 nuclear transport factor 2 family protein [Zobellia uliginosa]
MKNNNLLLVIGFLMIFSSLSAQNNDTEAIENILESQAESWSNHDLEGFMQGYWKSDELTYYSGGKITKGWQTTLDNYKKGYPNKEATGVLNFQIDEITKINEESYYVMGQYFLQREVGDAHGTFMIIFKKINGEWKIIADSSC